MGARYRLTAVTVASVAAVVCFCLPLAAPALADGPAPQVATPGHPVSVGVTPTVVGDPLSYPEGPGAPAAPSSPRPAASNRSNARSAGSPRPALRPGEGLVWLTMSAPGTSWASRRDTAAVVKVRLDAGPAQSVVLFYGARPFTYEGFVGPVGPGRHRITVSVDPAASDLQGVAPAVKVLSASLAVVPAASPDYLIEAYAPVLYGRPSAGRRYTPLLDDAAESTLADGSHQLSYVMVFSAHDQGDSIVPAYQWGLWGRMTDVVSVLDEVVAPDGHVTSATYASCGCEKLPWPSAVMSPEETTAAFAGTWYGHHPVLRDATATNYMSDQGTSPFRFQQAPVAAPGPGQLRSQVMDLHPWTYRVSDEELPREHLISTNPDDLLVGDYRQYAIVDANLSVAGTQSVAVELRLAGSPTWYSSDYRQATGGVPSAFPFHDGGHWRTVVKLPTDWASRPITGIRLRLEAPPASPTPAAVSVESLKVLEVTPGFGVTSRSLPPLGVYRSTTPFPASLPG